MNALYVLYDSHCGLCTEVQEWLSRQPAFVDLHVLSSSSEEASRRFSSLAKGELAVVSDEGDVWYGDNAFILCLWALRDYRDWALRLARPMLRPLARSAFAALSHNRHNISQLLNLTSEEELKRRLHEVPPSTCPTR